MAHKRFSVMIFEDEVDIAQTMVRSLKQQCPEARILWYKNIGVDGSRGRPPHNEETDYELAISDVFACDVAIFDMKMGVAEADPWALANPWGEYEGMGFVLENEKNFSPQTSVYIFTGHDTETIMIDDLCQKSWCSDSGPYFGKWVKSSSPIDELIASEILPLYEAHQVGITPLAFRQVRFAGEHDLPVLIIGETGTGKEMIAQWIHQAWWKKHHGTDNNQIPPLATINCAGLSSELARDELFGHVRGAFTDAQEHKLGTCLRAAGIAPFSRKRSASINKEADKVAQFASRTERALKRLEDISPGNQAQTLVDIRILINDAFAKGDLFRSMSAVAQGVVDRAGSDSMEDYRKRLEEANMDDIKPLDNSVDLVITKNYDAENNAVKESHEQACLGTLFLDEFGDLPSDVQTLLLRYLTSWEVQPLGFEGVIHGAKVRIIAATSDPKLAAYAGFDKDHFFSMPRAGEFREDLFYRVAYQVIRVRPLESIEVRHLIEFLTEQPGFISWEPDAIEFVETEIFELEKERPRPSFGHRREIRRVVDLAQQWVLSAESRGIRRPRITENLIKSLWRPALVTPGSWDVNGLSQAANQSETKTEMKWDLNSRSLQIGNKEISIKGASGLVFDLLVSEQGSDVSVERIIEEYEKEISLNTKNHSKKISDLKHEINSKLKGTSLRIVAKQVKGKTVALQLTAPGQIACLAARQT